MSKKRQLVIGFIHQHCGEKVSGSYQDQYIRLTTCQFSKYYSGLLTTYWR